MKHKYFILAVIAVVIVSAAVLWYVDQKPRYGVVIIDGKELRVEVANTSKKRIRGLAERENMGDISGMLFDFPVFGKHGIWMKDMNFPIDIVWLNNAKIVDISPNVSPELGTDFIFYPRENANYVLELPANFTKENDLQIGEEVGIRY